MAVGQKVALNVEVPEDLITRFDIARAQRGRMKKQEAVAKALETWISAGADAPAPQEPEIIPAFADLSPEQRAKVETYAETLRSGKKGKEISCPDDLARAVTGLIKFMKIPADTLDPDMLEMRQVMKRMVERRA